MLQFHFGSIKIGTAIDNCNQAVCMFQCHSGSIKTAADGIVTE